MPDLKGKTKKIPIFSGNEGLAPQSPELVGVPKVFNLEKKPRQSTDLEEYDFVVPKNFA